MSVAKPATRPGTTPPHIQNMDIISLDITGRAGAGCTRSDLDAPDIWQFKADWLGTPITCYTRNAELAASINKADLLSTRVLAVLKLAEAPANAMEAPYWSFCVHDIIEWRTLSRNTLSQAA